MADSLEGVQLMLGPTSTPHGSQQPLQGSATQPFQPHAHLMPMGMSPFGLTPSTPAGEAQMPSTQQFMPMNVNLNATMAMPGLSSPATPVAAGGMNGAANTPQALMGVLNLLQQNIGALQALVPLLAGPQQNQPLPQAQPQLQTQQCMVPAASSGVMSAITQLANTTASLLPQLSAVAMQQHQQPFMQQPLQMPQTASPTSPLQGTLTHPLSTPAPQPSPPVPHRQMPATYVPKEQQGTVVAPRHRDMAKGEEMSGALATSGDGDDADDSPAGDGEDGNDEFMPAGSFDIVEMDPVEILAEHTHFCEICGKGFKRDANLRMHMRGHGDEYKTPSALARPDKQLLDQMDVGGVKRIKRFSCPYVGCKRNQQHKRFTPLKTMLCVKNHYRRSHCPKMLTCSKCGTKRFSVVADLRTHEKHCGRDRWLCSCGTSFSRKDKLLGHLSLFAGHKAAVPTGDEDCTPSQKLPYPYDAPANSTSGVGGCNGRSGRAGDCASSTLNLNNPSVEEDGVEREVVVYRHEQTVPIIGQASAGTPAGGVGTGFRQPAFMKNFI